MCTKVGPHKRDQLNRFLSFQTKMQPSSMVSTTYQRLQLHANCFIQSDQKWENDDKFDIKINSARYRQHVTAKGLQNSNKTLTALIIIFHVTFGVQI